MPPVDGVVEIAEVVRLRPGVTASWPEPDRLLLAHRARRHAIGGVLPDVRVAVEVVASAGATETALVAGVPEHDATARRQLGDLLARLRDRGWAQRTIVVGGKPLLTVRPVAARSVPWVRPFEPEQEVVLSRFAFLRRDRDELLIESPRAHAVVVLHDPAAAALVALLARRARSCEVVGRAEEAGLPAPATVAALGVLRACDLVVSADPLNEEDDSQELAQWSFADLLFHARSRQGRHDEAYGATWPLRARFEPLPIGVLGRGDPVPLPRPDLAAIAAADPPLTDVLEGRRSVRLHDDRHPVTLAQLAEFLYRCAGVRAEVTRFSDGTERPYGCARPYPSGGALYELEVYLVVERCAGLDPGLYHYDALRHRLGRTAAAGPHTSGLLDDAGRKSATGRRPQVLVVLAARVGRVMFKYESISYAVILKNVGVLYQTMYTVATAMGLAACALGGGDSDLFAKATGLRYFEETSVGELMLGSSLPGSPNDA